MMKMNLRGKLSRALVPAVLALGAVSNASAQVTTTAQETAITDASTAILGLIGVAGLAMIGIAVAFVGWRVGVKFVKRLGGAA